MGRLRHFFGPDGGRLRRPFRTELRAAEKLWQELYIFAGMLLKVLRVRGQRPPRHKKCSGFKGSIPKDGKSVQGSKAVPAVGENASGFEGSAKKLRSAGRSKDPFKTYIFHYVWKAFCPTACWTRYLAQALEP